MSWALSKAVCKHEKETAFSPSAPASPQAVTQEITWQMEENENLFPRPPNR